MKYTKLCAILLSVLLITVVGCSGGETDSKQSDKAKSETTTSAQSATSTEKATASTTETKKPTGVAASDEEVKFLSEIEKLANSAKKVDELRTSLLDIEGVSDVLVFKNSDDVVNTENQIYKGDVVVEETYVKVFYDNSKSWVAFTIFG